MVELVIELPELERRDDGAAAFELGSRRRFGARLRAVRHLQGHRLQDIEARSGGRVDADLLAAYERGDRAITPQALAVLADAYAVTVEDLLPGEDTWPSHGGTTPRDGDAPLGVQLSVPALHACSDPSLDPLQELVRHVRMLRGDLHGQVLSLRTEDLRTIAQRLDLTLDELPAYLADRDLLATR